MNKISWVFFGTDRFSTIVLDELKNSNLVPKLIITTEDKPKGRKLLITPPDVKMWAEKNNIPYYQPKTLKDDSFYETLKKESGDCDLFIVASYGKIIPDKILNIPKHKTLNVHPSLLPKLRGPSPIMSSILSEEETGVSIMRLDAEMDHGPILAQEKISVEWPPYSDELENICAKTGAILLSKIIPGWISGDIKEIEQDHKSATYCKKIEKKDAELDLNDTPEKNLRKIRAFNIWPIAYFFETNKDRKIRILVTRAKIENENLLIEKIIPEGKKEMLYSDYIRGKK